jgi:hypothetical protein
MVIQVLETVTKEEEKKRERVGCVHPTPDYPVRQAGRRWTGCSREKAKAYDYNLPDRLVVHRTVRWANGRPRDLRATRGPQQRSVGHIGLSGVHRTLSSAPIDPEDQQSDAPEKEGDRAPDSYSDCPVVHQTV